MDGWGTKLLTAVTDVAVMAAEGFGLPPDAFSSRMVNGPHLLAPTGRTTKLRYIFIYIILINLILIHFYSRL